MKNTCIYFVRIKEYMKNALNKRTSRIHLTITLSQSHKVANKNMRHYKQFRLEN